MDRLTAMEVFVRVVEKGSFTAAATHLRLSRAMVSKTRSRLGGASWRTTPQGAGDETTAGGQLPRLDGSAASTTSPS